LEALKYVEDPQRGLALSDGKHFILDVTEFTMKR
jgi:hypothetical protein